MLLATLVAVNTRTFSMLESGSFSKTTPPALFDTPCAGMTDGNPVCACQINCGSQAPCPKTDAVCNKVDGCFEVATAPNNPWGTLKRAPSDEEMDIFSWSGMEYSMGDVEGLFGSLKGGDGRSR